MPGVPSPLQFEDRNFTDRYGWKEIVIGAGAGAAIVTASQGSADRGAALSDIPRMRLLRPRRICGLRSTGRSTGGLAGRCGPHSAHRAAGARSGSSPGASGAESNAKPGEGRLSFTLAGQGEIAWQWLLLGLVVAFGLGGAHALEPGHGKTIVAAYLVGSRGTMKHAAVLGAVVTFTHTISVFLLGLAMLVLSQSVVPANIIKTLEAASGMAIVAIGAMPFYERLRQLLHAGHPHDHGPHTHTHTHDLPEGEVTLGSLIALGVSGGRVPCPAALVIMLAAIAFGHVGAGLVLLAAFSLGLAGVLMAVGMMVLYARSWLPNPDAASRHPIFRLVPVLSALIIVCLGLLMTGVSLGWVRPGLSV